MKYTINGFSQKVLCELKLDPTDALILRWFVDFNQTSKMKSIINNKNEFYWVNYDGVLKSLPILNMEKRSIQRRFKKLVNAGVLDHYTHKQGGTFSCYKKGTNYESLIDDNKEAVHLNPTVGLKSTTPKDSKVLTKDSSINDSSINSIWEEYPSYNEAKKIVLKQKNRDIPLLKAILKKYKEEEIINTIIIYKKDNKYIKRFDNFLKEFDILHESLTLKKSHGLSGFAALSENQEEMEF